MKYIAVAHTEVADLHIVYSGGLKTLIRLEKGQELPVDILDPIDVKKSLAFGALGRLIKAGWIKEIQTDAEVLEFQRKLKTIIFPSETEKAKALEDLQEKRKTKVEASKYSVVETISSEELQRIRDEKGMVQSVDTTEGNGQAIKVEQITFEQAITTNKSGGLTVSTPELRSDTPNDVVMNEKTGKVEKVGLGIEEYKTKGNLVDVKDYHGFDNLNHFDQLSYLKDCQNVELLNEIASKNVKKQIINNAKKRLSELG
jgi:hypothetical protein